MSANPRSCEVGLHVWRPEGDTKDVCRACGAEREVCPICGYDPADFHKDGACTYYNFSRNSEAGGSIVTSRTGHRAVIQPATDGMALTCGECGKEWPCPDSETTDSHLETTRAEREERLKPLEEGWAPFDGRDFYLRLHRDFAELERRIDLLLTREAKLVAELGRKNAAIKAAYLHLPDVAATASARNILEGEGGVAELLKATSVSVTTADVDEVAEPVSDETQKAIGGEG